MSEEAIRRFEERNERRSRPDPLTRKTIDMLGTVDAVMAATVLPENWQNTKSGCAAARAVVRQRRMGVANLRTNKHASPDERSRAADVFEQTIIAEQEIRARADALDLDDVIFPRILNHILRDRVGVVVYEECVVMALTEMERNRAATAARGVGTALGVFGGAAGFRRRKDEK